MSLLNRASRVFPSTALHFLATAILAFSSTLAYGTNSDERIITGKWRVTAALDGADIASLDEREAKRLVKTIVTIGPDNVQFGTHACGSSTFEAESVEPRLFLRRQFHASTKHLSLPNPVTAVTLNCTTVFIKNPDKLLIFWDGWFFDAVRIKP